MKLEPISKNFVRLLLYTIISIACLNPLMSRDIIFIDNSNPNSSSFLTSPTIIITSSDVADGSLSNDGSISLTFTSSESTTDFIESDITVSGGSISSFSGSGTTYNATFTPSGDGATTIDVAADTFTDSAGNGNTAASQFNWTYDGTPPTIVISSTVISDGSTVNNSSVVFNFETSESSSNFGQSDITVNGGTITGFSGGGTNYSATFTPSLDGAKTIQIVSGAFTDSAGNSNTPSNIFSFTFDSTPPTIDSISSSSGDGFYGEDEQIAVRIDFSEPVSLTNGLLNIVLETGANDRVVSIGSSNITSVTSATGTYTIISGDNSTNLDATQVNLSSGQLVDIAGNEMSDFIFSNNISSSSQIVIDTTPPTMDITAQVGATQIQEGSTTNDTSINLIFTFSEDVTDFVAGDISLLNGGSISQFSQDSSDKYTATFTPVGDGPYTIQVSSSKYLDLAGNVNSVDSSFSWNYESTTYPTIQITESSGLISEGSTSNDGTVTLIFTASEDIKNFDANDIQVINGEQNEGNFSNFLKLSNKLYRITFSPSSDGEKTIFIQQGTFSDLFDNSNDLASSFSWIYDGSPPNILSLTAKAGNVDILNDSITNDSSLNFTVTFDDEVTGFEINDLNVVPANQGEFSLFQKIDSKTYKFSFTPLVEDEFVIYISENSYFDSAGNRNNSSTQFEWQYDVSPPLISISSPTVNDGATTNESDVVLQFKANEPINGFDVNEISVNGGSISQFSAESAILYTAVFSPDSNGSYEILVGAELYTDLADNLNIQSSQFSFSYDNSSPSVSITSQDVLNGQYTNNSTIGLDFISNVPITGFDINDLTSTGNMGSFSAFSGSGSSYTATYTANTEGVHEIRIDPFTFTDLNNNDNSVESSYSFTYDSTPPTIEISSSVIDGSTTNDNNINVTFTLSESSTNFIKDDISVTSGSLSNFSGSGKNYSAVLTPTSDGITRVNVVGGKFTDLAGNSNLSSSEFSWTYDGTSPTIEISSSTVSSGSSTNDSSITLDFNLSENSINFQASDITVTNGSVSDFTTHSGSNYSAKITPTSDGLLSIAVSDGAFTDSYDNPNFASSPFLWNYDGTSPTVSISSPFVSNGSVTNLESLRINFLVSETTNFDESIIEVTGGTLSGFSNSDSGYYAFFEPQDGTSNIKIRSNQFSDSVGNLNLSNTEFTFEYDGTPPTVTISTDDVTEGGSTNLSEIFLTFSFDESVVGLNSGDFQLTNGSLTNFGGTGSTYSAKFLPSATDNECIIRLVAGTYSDSAGNLNENIDEFRFNFDSTQPTIEISSPNIDNGGSISASSIDVNFTLSEASTGFIQTDIDLEGGSIISFSGSDSDYTAKLSFTTQGVKTLKVINGAFTDSASNPNTTSNIFSWTFDNQPPTITLDGEPLIQLEVNDIYNDPGVQEPSDNLDTDVEIQISGVVDVTKLGDYEVEYTAVDNAGNNSSVKRTFRVLDNTKPEILLDPNDEIVYLNVGDSYSLPFFDYSDNYDEKSDLVVLSQPTQSDLPNTSTVGVTELRWSVRDKSFNVSEKNIQIIVGSPPIITMLENPPYEIELDEPFEIPGAYAQDYNGAPLTLNTTIVPADNTDTSTVRSFQVFYNAKDSQNRETNISKTVNIVDKIKPVLSFDPIDGEILTWEVNTVYNDPGGVTATDNYDSEDVIQSRIQPYTGTVDTSKLGRNNLFFDVSDISGNVANTLTRFVDVEDTTPPSIQLDGAGTIGVKRKENFVDPGVILNDNYDQSSDIVQISTIRNGNDDVVTVVNTYVLDTYTITYSARDTSGNETAEQDQITRTVIIEPIVDASASSTVVCAGESVTLGSSDTDLQDADGNNYTIEWTSSPDIGVELGNTRIVSAIVTQTTIFTLTLRDSDGNTFSDSSTVQVNPLPSFTVQEDAEICEGSSINLGVGIVDESAAGYAYRWESLNNGFISSAVNPLHTPISSDTVTLTVTSPAGCQESDSFEITVVEKPIITFPTGDEFEICEGDTFTITSTLFNVQNAENYSWSVTPQGTGTFEDSETDSDVTIFTPNSTGIAAGQVLLTLTATDQTPCTGSKAESITLDISPQATLSLSPVNSVVCSTSQIEIDIIGDNYDINSLIVTPSSALVNLSSKKIFYTPSASDITNGSVTIELSANQLSSCTGTINTGTTISVIPQATVDITSSPIVECYDPASPLISLEDSGAEITNAASFEWRVTSGGGSVVGGDFSDPKTWFYSPPTSVPTTATLELFVTPNSPCPDSEVTPQTLVIELHQTPEIIKKADNITFCEGDDIEITSDIIEYNNSSQSDFLWTTTSGGIQPGSFTAGTSSSAYSVYQPSQEDIDNGFVDLTITVTPNASSACEEPVSETIRFNVNKTKIVELGDPVDVCESQGYFDLVNSTITDTNDPPNPYTPTSGVSWERADNGSVDGFDSSTSLTPRFTFSQSDIDNGQVIVKMTYDDGLCNTISDTKIINIIRTPFADLGAPIDICVGDQTVLNNFIIRPVGAGNITWELLADSGASGLSLFGENSQTPTLNATDSATGSYQLKVTIDPLDGCGDQVVETVDVNVIEKPTVDLSLVDPDNFEVCQGDDFTFSIDDINILTEHAGGYTWSSLGDGSFDQPGNLTSIKKRPDYYRPGPNDITSGRVELILTLTPESPCTAEDSQSITIPISRNPVIQVPPSQEVDLCSKDGMVIQMIDYFSVANETEYSYAWSTSDNGIFQDPSSLNARYTPSPFEKNRGDVKLTLTATDSDCSSVDSKTVTFYFHDNPTISVGNDDEVILCDGDEYYQTDGYLPPNPRLQSGFSYAWSTDGDGYFDPSHTELKPKYIPGEQDRTKRKNDEGSTGVELKLTLVSTTACVVEVADSLQLFFEPKPTVSLPSDLDVCSSIPSIELSSTAIDVDPSSYLWTREDGNGTFDGPTNETSTNTNPVYYFGDQDITNGSVEIKLTVKGNDGCSNTSVSDTQTITLIPPPTANVSSQPITICYPSNLTEEELAEWEGQELDIVGIFGENAAENYSRVEWTPVDSTKGEVTKNGNTLAPFFKPTISSGTTKLLLKAYPTNDSTCATDSPYCCEAAQSELTVNIVSEPVITFPSNQKICQGEPFYLTPTDIDLGTITDYELLWTVSPSDEGELFNETSDTPYYIPLDDQVGDVVFNLAIRPLGDSVTECTGSLIEKQFTLTIEPSTVVDAGPTEVAICIGDSYTTNFANVQYSSDPSTWQWSTDSPNTPGSFRLDCDNSSTEDNTGLNVSYCPSQDDYDRGFVNLTLTVPNEGVCIDNPDVTDTITLRFIPKPTVEIKEDEDGFSTTVCGDEYVFSSGQVILDNEDPSSLKWETNGNGTFTGGDNILEPTYKPGSLDIQNGEVTLTLTVTGADGCSQNAFDVIDLTIPTLDLSSSPTTVCINDTIDLEAKINPELTPDQYTITWEVQNVGSGQIIENADTLKPTFKPLQSGPVTVIAKLEGNDFCTDPETVFQQEIEIDVVGLPVITLPPSLIERDKKVCFEDTFDLEDTDVPGVNAFVDSVKWTDYYFTLNNDGTEAEVQEGGEPLSGLFANTTNPDFGLYTPSDKINDYEEQVYVRLTMTAYAFKPPCDTPQDDVSQSFTLTLTPTPKILNSEELWGDATVCAGEDDLYKPLLPELSNYDSYEWSSTTSSGGEWFDRDSLEPSYRPSESEINAGKFTLKLTVSKNGSCKDTSIEKEITVVPTPIVELSDLDVCYPTNYDPDSTGFLISPTRLENFSSILWSAPPLEENLYTPGNFSINSNGWVGNVNNTGDSENGYRTYYYPSADDYTNGKVVITLTANPNDPCAATVSNTIELILTPEPVIDVGGPYNVCEDQDSIQLNGSVINGTILSWSSPEGFSSNDLNAIYTLTDSDKENGEVTLTLTAIGEGNCGNRSKDVTIEITKRVIVNNLDQQPFSDVDLCVVSAGGGTNNYLFDEISISNYDSYVWSSTTAKGELINKSDIDGSFGGVFEYRPNPDDPDIGEVEFTLTVTPKDPCLGTTSYTKKLIYHEEVEINVEDPFEVCQVEGTGNSFTVSATTTNSASVQWRVVTPNSGILTDSSESIATYQPSVSDWRRGNVTLEVTAQPNLINVCGEKSETITIGLIAEPQVNIDADISADSNTDDRVICLNEQTQIHAFIDFTYDDDLSHANRKTSYTWISNGFGSVGPLDPQKPTENVYYIPDPRDVDIEGGVDITLEVINYENINIDGGCGERKVTDTVTLTVLPGPSAEIDMIPTACVGDEILISASIFDEGSVQWKAYSSLDYNRTDNATAGIGTEISGNFILNESENGTDYSVRFVPNYNSISQEDIDAGIQIELGVFGQNTNDNISSPCLTYYTHKTVNFDQKPVILFGDQDKDGVLNNGEVEVTDFKICQGETLELSNIYPSVNHGINITWTSTGNGLFNGSNNSTILEPTYTPGTQDIINGQVTLTLTVDAVGACADTTLPVSKDLILYITSPPTVTVIPSFDVCLGVEDLSITVNGDNPNQIIETEFLIPGTTVTNASNVEWDHNGEGQLIVENVDGAYDLKPVYVPTQEDVGKQVSVFVKVIGENECNKENYAAKETIILNILPAPSLSAGNNTSVCVNEESYTFDNGAIAENVQNIFWSHDGTGSITDGQGTLTPTYEFGPNETGTVDFTVTADGYSPGVTNPDQNFCNFTLERSFTLTISEEPSISIKKLSNSVDGDPISTFCTNSEIYLEYEGSDFAAIDQTNWSSNGEGSFVNVSGNIWQFFPTEQDKIDVLQGGKELIVTITASGTDGCESSISDSVSIQFSPEPVAIINSGAENGTLCPDVSSFDLVGFVDNHSDFYWRIVDESGTGSFDPGPLENQTSYIPSPEDRNDAKSVQIELVAVGFDNCGEASDTITIDIIQNPFVEIENSTVTICESDEIDFGDVTADSLFKINGGGYDEDNVEWTSSSGGGFVENSDKLRPKYIPTPQDISNGEVTLYVKVYGNDECGSTLDNDEIKVQFSKEPKVEYLVNNNGVEEGKYQFEICEGESFIYFDGAEFTNVTEIEWRTTSHPEISDSALQIDQQYIGTGYFDFSDIEKPRYFPSDDDFTNVDGGPGHIRLLVVGRNQGACAPDAKRLDIKLIRKAIITADQTLIEVCETNNSVDINNSTTNILVQNVGTEFINGEDNILWSIIANDNGYTGFGEIKNENSLNPTYEPSGSDKQQGVSLRLSITGQGETCGFVDTKDFEIRFIDKIEIEAGNSGTICKDESFEIAGASYSGPSDENIRWRAFYSIPPNYPVNQPDPNDLADGTFDDFRSLTPIYTPGESDIAQGTVYLVLESTEVSHECGNSFDYLTLEIESQISVYSPPVLNVCSDHNGGSILVEGYASRINSSSWVKVDGSSTSTLGITPIPGTDNIYYDIQEDDIINGYVTLKLSATGSGNCNVNSESTTLIQIYQAINATAGETASICDGNNYEIKDSEIFSDPNVIDRIEWTVDTQNAGTLLSSDSIHPTFVPDTNFTGNEVQLTLKIYPINIPIDSYTIPGEPQKSSHAPCQQFSMTKKLIIANDLTNISTAEIVSDSGDTICSDETSVKFSISNLENALYYNWTIPEGATFENNTSENDTEIYVSFAAFDKNSNKRVSVVADNGCEGQSIELEKDIEIRAQPILTLTTANDVQELCYNSDLSEIVYELSGGAVASEIDIQWATDGADWDSPAPEGFESSLSKTSTTLKIAGSYSSASLSGKVYEYRIINDSSDCYVGEVISDSNGNPITGTITFKEPPTITHDTDPSNGELDQNMLCSGTTEIDEITISYDADSVIIDWPDGEPDGIDYNDDKSGTITIGGFPKSRDGELTSIFRYELTPIDSQGCEGDSIEGSFEVDAQSSIVANPSNPSISPAPDFCDGELISYSFTLGQNASQVPVIKYSIGGNSPPTVGQKPSWIQVSTLSVDKTFTLFGIVNTSESQTIEFYIDKPINSCSGGGSISPDGKFNIHPNPTIDIRSGVYDIDGDSSEDTSGPRDQTLCEGEELNKIILEISDGSVVTADNLPDGISLIPPSPGSSNPYIIRGTPSNANGSNYIFDYVIEAQSPSGCKTDFTGTIIRNVKHTLIPTNSFQSNQIICEGSSIEEISFTYSTGADGVDDIWYIADDNGLQTFPNDPLSYTEISKPNEINVDDGDPINNPKVSITGNPSVLTAASQTIYRFELVTFSSSTCDSGTPPQTATASGKITVNPKPFFERQSNFSTESFCEGTDVSIAFKTDDNVTINDPVWSQNLSDNTIKPVRLDLDSNGYRNWELKGKVNDVQGDVNLNYTLEAVNTSTFCSTEISGTIIINNKHDLDIITPNLDVQMICQDSAIQDILYRFGGAANSVRFKTPLINGLEYEFLKEDVDDENESILRIYGTPNESVTSDVTRSFFIETVSNTSDCEAIEKEIKITIKPIPKFVSSQTTVVACEGQPMDDLVFTMMNDIGIISFDFQWTDGQPNNIIPLPNTSGPTPTFTLTGTPNGVDDDKRYPFTLQAIGVGSNSCVSEIIEGSILVQNSHEIGLSINSKATQEICAGDEIEPITINWGGGAETIQTDNLPAGLNLEPGDKKITIFGTPISNGGVDLDFSFTTLNNANSCDSKSLPIKISVVKQPTITVNLNSPGTRIQTGLCEGDNINDIYFDVENGVTDVDIIWTPQRPGFVYLDDVDIINGNVSLKGEINNIDPDVIYEYEIIAVNNDKSCFSDPIKGSLQANQKHELDLSSTFITTSQNICYLEQIEEIIYTFGGGADSARVDGLPRGIDYRIEDNKLIIFGSLEQQIENTSENEYTVITSGIAGNKCDERTEKGTFTLQPNPIINLESPISNINQFICEGEAIEDIVYTFAGEAKDYVASKLPPGLVLTEVRDTLGGNDFIKKLTISGTPNINVIEDKLYEFEIKALGNNSCDQDLEEGAITIKANAELTLISDSESDKQIVCVGEEIDPIIIKYENSNIPVVRNMPNGLRTEVDLGTKIFKILGYVDDGSDYTFSVYGVNANGCESLDVPIELIVEPSFSILPPRIVEDPNDINNTGGASYVKNITCYGNDDGQIRVNLQGGSAAAKYSFVWSGPDNYVNTTQLNYIENLSPGTYNVTVAAQGARDCSISETFIVSEPLPLTITTNEIRPVSCTGSEDGLISVTIGGGNQDFYRNFVWEVLQEDVSCTTYTIRLRDNDNDGIFDIVDADIDNDGSTDPGKTDVNADGMIDEANDSNYSFGTVSYQSCDGVLIINNILRGEFSANGIYQVCAIPNTISSAANLDHDLDPTTDDIASVSISGGTSSCSSAETWTRIDRLKGSSLASNLIEGIYRLTVVEGPDLNDIESNDLESLRNDPDICTSERIFELPKDQILYGSVRVDETYCSLSGGYIDVDVNQNAGDVYFYYDGVRVPNTDVEVIAAEFGINTYRVLIQNPNSNGSFEIRNATGCGVVVAQDLLDTNVITPVISYTSPELDKYGTISERSNILFTLAGNPSYYRVEWDFGDASPIAVGERVSHQYFADGTYTVTVYVYNASGCFSTATQEVVVGKGYTILMPNAFSPNGDNINEIIGPVFTGLKAVEYYIYNSQGILVYQEFVSEENLSPNGKIEIKGWDGENSDPSSNFYIFKIIGTRINEELVTRTGTVFLIE